MNAQTTKGTELNRQKRSDPIRALAVKYVVKKFDVSEMYVYKIAADSNRTGGLADEIRKAYRAKYAELKEIIA
jgi:hypothetical protein